MIYILLISFIVDGNNRGMSVTQFATKSACESVAKEVKVMNLYSSVKCVAVDDSAKK